MDLFEFLRQFRIGPFAVFDFAISYLGIYLLAPRLTKIFAKGKLYISRTDWLWLTLPIAILFHIVFAADTPLTKMVVDLNGFYAIKLLILIMLFMGLRASRNPKNNK